MKFTTSTIVASAAALASAAPACSAPSTTTTTVAADNSTSAFPRPGVNDAFQIMAIRSGAPFHYSSIQAISSSFQVAAPKQNSTCLDPTTNYATFTLTEDTGDLYLYTDNPPHQAVVDRSGMGQGHFGYTTGVQPIGKNQERGPFKINEDGDVVFAATNGVVGFQACPGAVGGGYSVWLTGVTEPAGLKGCLGFVAKALKEENPQKCEYTVAGGV
jgi:hypothetical protein